MDRLLATLKTGASVKQLEKEQRQAEKSETKSGNIEALIVARAERYKDRKSCGGLVSRRVGQVLPERQGSHFGEAGQGSKG